MSRVQVLLLFVFLQIIKIESSNRFYYNMKSADTVKFSLYYEVLCPYCREFVKDQLFPTYQKLGDSLILDLVPFGNAKQSRIENKWNFTCQHGPRECVGNKIQACVLKSSAPARNKMAFVACMLASSNPGSSQIAQQCATRNGISWIALKKCFLTEQGDDLLAECGEITQHLDPKLKGVPYIIFNGVFNETLEVMGREDLKKTVCLLLDQKPAACKE